MNNVLWLWGSWIQGEMELGWQRNKLIIPITKSPKSPNRNRDWKIFSH